MPACEGQTDRQTYILTVAVVAYTAHGASVLLTKSSFDEKANN